MKTALFFCSPLLLGVSLLSIGCGKSDETSTPSAEVDDAGTAKKASDGGSKASGRTLVEGNLLPTGTTNMLLDPGFSLLGSQSQGQFFAFTANGSTVTLTSRFDSSSPVGVRGGALYLADPAATDTSSKSITLLSSFVGGKASFSSRVWISHSNANGDPAPFPDDEEAISVTIASGDVSDGFPIKRTSTKPYVANGRTWVQFGGRVENDIKGGFFLVTTGTSGGTWLLAAPEVLSTSSLPEGNSLRSSTPTIRSRRLTESERSAIQRYASFPPQLGIVPKPRLPE